MRKYLAAWGALSVMAASALLAVPHGAARAADPVCIPPSGDASVVFTWDGAASGCKKFSAADLFPAPPQLAANYPFNRPGCLDGHCYDLRPPGWPLHNLLADELGVSFVPDAVQTMTITATTSHSLTGVDLKAPNEDGYPFLPNGDTPPFPITPYLFVNGNPGPSAQLIYLRPQRKDTPNDYNAFDEVDTLGGGSMEIHLTVGGAVLTPRLQVSTTAPGIGQPVSFQALLDSPPAGSHYQWIFGDGQMRDTDTPSFTYAYRTTGTFSARVVVRAPGAAGQSALVTMAVGPGHSPSTGPSAPGHGTATIGPSNGPEAGSGVQAGGGPSAATPGPSGATPNTAAPGASGRSSSAVSAGAYVNVRGIVLNAPGVLGETRTNPRAGSIGAAPAERAGSVPAGATPVFGAVVCASLIALMAIGALGERRRPRHGPRRGS